MFTFVTWSGLRVGRQIRTTPEQRYSRTPRSQGSNKLVARVPGPCCALQLRHNESDDVSNRQPHDCLLNRLCKAQIKARVTGLCEGNSPVTGEFPAQKDSNTENVSIWCRHHGAICSDVSSDENSQYYPVLSYRFALISFTQVGIRSLSSHEAVILLSSRCISRELTEAIYRIASANKNNKEVRCWRSGGVDLYYLENGILYHVTW